MLMGYNATALPMKYSFTQLNRNQIKLQAVTTTCKKEGAVRSKYNNVLYLVKSKSGTSCRTTGPISSTSRRPKVGRGEKRGRRKEEKKAGRKEMYSF